ncbi:MAG: hypothetical protein ACYTBP_05850 [Planctomycetota bacterium]|jgi:hypothetical protein
MKTLIKTIMPFLILSCVVTCFADQSIDKLKNDLKKKNHALTTSVAELKDLSAMTKDLAVKAASDSRSYAEEVLESVQASLDPLGAGVAFGTGTGASARVLVIPEEEMERKKILTIAEDLNIMARIIDKQLKDEDLCRDFHWFYGNNFFEWNLPVTKCIYIEGNGSHALFLKKVDFPLSAPVKEEEKKVEEDFDPLWHKTRQEMYFRNDKLFKSRHKHKGKLKDYDEQKVENLKQTLVQTLKHAANIRDLDSDDWIIITVIGESGASGRVIKKRSVIITDKEPVIEEVTESTGDAVLFPPTVLTIRVTKKNVDDYASDKMDFKEFQQKVKILKY